MARKRYVPVLVDHRLGPRVDDKTVAEIRRLTKVIYEARKQIKSYDLSANTIHRINTHQGAYK